MSKRHSERRKVGEISVGAWRLALVSCPHQDGACPNCLAQCQREVEDSARRAAS